MLQTLRWEFYQHYTLALLWLDGVDSGEQHEIDNQMVVDGPSGIHMLIRGKGVKAGDRVASLSLMRDEEHTRLQQQVEDASIGSESDC